MIIFHLCKQYILEDALLILSVIVFGTIIQNNQE